jgi:hypothetical protein
VIGDAPDIFTRLKGMLPSRWFGTASDSAPLIDGVLYGLATSLAFIYSLYAYAKLQTRIMSATDGWLDLIAVDFFGANGLRRKPGQSDTSYRTLIIANLFREKATRKAITMALQTLTGRTPIIVEPRRPADTMDYGVSTSGYGSGYYGSLLLPYQAFVQAFRPVSFIGIANVAGYGISTAGYSQASQACYSPAANIQSGISDADIFAAIDAVKPAASEVWTVIK